MQRIVSVMFLITALVLVAGCSSSPTALKGTGIQEAATRTCRLVTVPEMARLLGSQIEVELPTSSEDGCYYRARDSSVSSTTANITVTTDNAREQYDRARQASQDSAHELRDIPGPDPTFAFSSPSTRTFGVVGLYGGHLERVVLSGPNASLDRANVLATLVRQRDQPTGLTPALS